MKWRNFHIQKWLWPIVTLHSLIFCYKIIKKYILPNPFSNYTCIIFAGRTFKRVQVSRCTKLYRSPGTLLAKFCWTLSWSRSYWSNIGCQPNSIPSFWKALVALGLELYRAAMLFLSCITMEIWYLILHYKPAHENQEKIINPIIILEVMLFSSISTSNLITDSIAMDLMSFL